jgi:hypothetical protein
VLYFVCIYYARDGTQGLVLSKQDTKLNEWNGIKMPMDKFFFAYQNLCQNDIF